MLDLRISILFCLLVVKTSSLRTGKDVKQFKEEDQEEQTFESLEHYFASRLQEDKNTKSDPIKDRPISNAAIGIGDFFRGNENSELLKGNYKLSPDMPGSEILAEMVVLKKL